MEKKTKKDEQLNAIFAQYIDEGKMPSKKVTFAAKDYLNKEYATEQVLAPVTETNDNGLNHSLNNSKNNKFIYLAAFIICAILIAFISYYFTKNALYGNQGVGLSLISLDQLDEKSLNYKEKDFLPFIEEINVNTYKEYSLKEDSDSYKAGDSIVYFIDYQTSENIDVSLYIENKGIYIIDLADFKNSKNKDKIENITFFYNFKNNKYFYYFNYKDYGYNLTINSSDKNQINNYLSIVANSFK